MNGGASPGTTPQVEIIALQMMPDHMHGIIFIKEKMEKDLSRIIRGFNGERPQQDYPWL